ncbi:zinc finger BED domain-containing protein RICESLEEPER 2-like protein, partial [Tanacetum coccineum]
LQKRVLSFVHVPPPRTALDIADGIYKCLKEWEIEGKIFSISVDNAAYNDKVVKTLKTNFSRVKKLPCEGRLLEEGLLEGHWGTKFNALEWWNVHQLKYPILSKMAKDVLAIPISTVASEATFSAGGRVIDPYRSALKSNTVEMLLCGGDWIRQNYGIKKKVKKEDIPSEVLLPTVKIS